MLLKCGQIGRKSDFIFFEQWSGERKLENFQGSEISLSNYFFDRFGSIFERFITTEKYNLGADPVLNKELKQLISQKLNSLFEESASLTSIEKKSFNKFFDVYQNLDEIIRPIAQWKLARSPKGDFKNIFFDIINTVFEKLAFLLRIQMKTRNNLTLVSIGIHSDDHANQIASIISSKHSWLSSIGDHYHFSEDELADVSAAIDYTVGSLAMLMEKMEQKYPAKFQQIFRNAFGQQIESMFMEIFRAPRNSHREFIEFYQDLVLKLFGMEELFKTFDRFVEKAEALPVITPETEEQIIAFLSEIYSNPSLRRNEDEDENEDNILDDIGFYAVAPLLKWNPQIYPDKISFSNSKQISSIHEKLMGKDETLGKAFCAHLKFDNRLSKAKISENNIDILSGIFHDLEQLLPAMVDYRSFYQAPDRVLGFRDLPLDKGVFPRFGVSDDSMQKILKFRKKLLENNYPTYEYDEFIFNNFPDLGPVNLRNVEAYSDILDIGSYMNAESDSIEFSDNKNIQRIVKKLDFSGLKYVPRGYEARVIRFYYFAQAVNDYQSSDDWDMKEEKFQKYLLSVRFDAKPILITRNNFDSEMKKLVALFHDSKTGRNDFPNKILWSSLLDRYDFSGLRISTSKPAEQNFLNKILEKLLELTTGSHEDLSKMPVNYAPNDKLIDKVLGGVDYSGFTTAVTPENLPEIIRLCNEGFSTKFAYGDSIVSHFLSKLSFAKMPRKVTIENAEKIAFTINELLALGRGVDVVIADYVDTLKVNFPKRPNRQNAYTIYIQLQYLKMIGVEHFNDYVGKLDISNLVFSEEESITKSNYNEMFARINLLRLKGINISTKFSVEPGFMPKAQSLEELADLSDKYAKLASFKIAVSSIDFFTLENISANDLKNIHQIEEIRKRLNEINLVLGDRFLIALGISYAKEPVSTGNIGDKVDVAEVYISGSYNIHPDVVNLYRLIGRFIGNKVGDFIEQKHKEQNLSLTTEQEVIVKRLDAIGMKVNLRETKAQKVWRSLSNGDFSYLARKALGYEDVEASLRREYENDIDVKDDDFKIAAGFEIKRIFLKGNKKVLAEMVEGDRTKGAKIDFELSIGGGLTEKEIREKYSDKLVAESVGAYTTGSLKPVGLVFANGELANYLIADIDGFIVFRDDGTAQILYRNLILPSLLSHGIRKEGEYILEIENNFDDYAKFIEIMKSNSLSGMQGHLLLYDGIIMLGENSSKTADKRRLFVTFSDGRFGILDIKPFTTLREAAEIAKKLGADAAINLDTGYYDHANYYSADGEKVEMGYQDKDGTNNKIVFFR